MMLKNTLLSNDLIAGILCYGIPDDRLLSAVYSTRLAIDINP